MNIVTIDFEASCLPRHGRSFPVEVGICADGSVHAWLIQPDPQWADWGWAQEAQALHGLSRDTLAAQGQSARTVMAELTDIVGARRLVADSDLDQVWLDTLADAARWPDRLKVGHVGHLLADWQVRPEAIASARTRADARQPARHRAGADAQWLAMLLGELAPIDDIGLPPPLPTRPCIGRALAA